MPPPLPAPGSGFKGNTNTGTNETIHDISQMMRPNLRYAGAGQGGNTGYVPLVVACVRAVPREYLPGGPARRGSMPTHARTRTHAYRSGWRA